VDKTVAVTVYNAGAPSGTAAEAAGVLKAAGYAGAAETFNASPTTPSATTIYYSTEAQAAAAADILAALTGSAELSSKLTGSPVTELNAQVGGGNIVVVVR
jgi:hypothetical protein